jgi:hypothetical protein
MPAKVWMNRESQKGEKRRQKAAYDAGWVYEKRKRGGHGWGHKLIKNAVSPQESG